FQIIPIVRPDLLPNPLSVSIGDPRFLAGPPTRSYEHERGFGRDEPFRILGSLLVIAVGLGRYLSINAHLPNRHPGGDMGVRSLCLDYAIPTGELNPFPGPEGDGHQVLTRRRNQPANQMGKP